jgi:biopolymer transport protein ExbD
LNDKPLNDKALKDALNGESRDSAVIVRADKTTLLERFVSLVDDVRGLGFQQVSLEVIRL